MSKDNEKGGGSLGSPPSSPTTQTKHNPRFSSSSLPAVPRKTSCRERGGVFCHRRVGFYTMHSSHVFMISPQSFLFRKDPVQCAPRRSGAATVSQLCRCTQACSFRWTRAPREEQRHSCVLVQSETARDKKNTRVNFVLNVSLCLCFV